MIGPIVSTEWLHAHLNDPNLRVVDIRGHVLPASEPPPHYFSHRDDYDASHIPGAVFVDWRTDITDPDSPTGLRVATPEAYAAQMSQLGIGDETTVVVYDDANGMFAARLWWTLRYYGHDEVAVLDGGWQRWTAEGRPANAHVPDVGPATFTPRPNPALRRSADEVQTMLGTDATLIDVRSPQEYAGQASRAKRAGHIPGALNVPRKTLLAEDGSLPLPHDLQARFAAAGIDGSSDQLITYCNAGVSAAFGMLALHVAGYTQAAAYDGSWKEWGNDESRPIE
jgi:thiosulfate/3-mercaptopyruvate sulfurtransferase